MHMIRLLLAAAIAALLAATPARAGEEKVPLDPKLEALLAKEKAARKACKVRICAILRSRKSEGEDISCQVVKTWLKEDIQKIIARSRLTWPWGHARCETQLSLERAMLAKAMSEEEYEAKLPSHRVACVLDRAKEGKTYEFVLNGSAAITFKNGKAVAGRITWGKLEAPTLIKGLLWSATGLDNKLNVFGGELVKIVNEFVTRKCAEVADDIAGLD